ncbi:MAG TPA: chemotaxis signal transduction protein CheV [Gammaproteobacteria bacterium]|nr:chemotaxis signal transduction protein CheV [Gammaproteobacteria bacterium]
MANIMQSVDERTRLAGANRFEVLLFSLGKDDNSDREEVFGINVFKVREVMHAPTITRAPDMPSSVEGMVSLRGETIPVINLPKFCGVDNTENPTVLIVTEYNRHIQGFLVHSVDSIKRLAWSEVRVPPAMMADRHGGLITAVTEIEDQGLVMVMDVEKILAGTEGFGDEEILYQGIESQEENITVLFADDSSVARKQIQRTLETMGINFIATVNGKDAWTQLTQLAEEAEKAGEKVAGKVQLILTDVEMPEMDGYVLTQKIKADARFNGIPVVMHSSLTTESNTALGERVGADAYVGKFAPQELSSTLLKVINKTEK